jgi:hypothetical protein
MTPVVQPPITCLVPQLGQNASPFQSRVRDAGAGDHRLAGQHSDGESTKLAIGSLGLLPHGHVPAPLEDQQHRVLSVARAADEAAPSGGAAVGVLSVIFVGVPAVLGPVPVGVLELAMRDRL